MKRTLLSVSGVLIGLSAIALPFRPDGKQTELEPGRNIDMTQTLVPLSSPERTGVKHSPAKAPSQLPDPIKDPEGRPQDYLESGDGYFYFLGIYLARDTFEDLPTDIVYGDEGEVYIKNILARYPTDTYVKGQLEDNKIIVTFPQLILIEKRDGSIYDYYVDRLNMEMVSETEATFWPSKERDVVFNILEDGIIEMEESDGSWAIGLTNNEDAWQGYADWNCRYVPNHYEMVEAPENLATETMQLIANYTGHEVEVGFDNEDVYIKGVCAGCPDAWIKGKMTGNEVVFENGQYLGIVDGFGYMGFFFGGEATPDPRWVWAYNFTENFKMTYDPETRTFSTEKPQCYIINDNDKRLHYMYTYRFPIIHPEGEGEDPTPQNCAPLSFNPYGESGACIGFKFYLPNLTVDNYLIPKEELYWSFYLDYEIYTFEPYLFEGLDKDLTEVPFNCKAEDIENKGNIVLHTIYIPIENFEEVGFMSIRYPDGEEYPYYSEIVTFRNPDVPDNPDKPDYPTPDPKPDPEPDPDPDPDPKPDDSVAGIEAEQNVRYFDLNGVRVAAPTEGRVYIVDKGSKKIKRVF